MKVRVVSDVKENTNLTAEEVIKNVPEDLDPILTTDVKIRNYIIRYFIHKNEIVATYVKTLKTSKKRNLFLDFLKEESSLLSDKDLYLLYKTYRNEEFAAYVDGNNEDHLKYEEYKDVLHEEIISRCDREC